jgi:hypothetical protein
MPDFKFTKHTDQEHTIKLDSYLIFAAWCNPFAVAGREAELQVGTAFAGQGAQIKITCKSEKGKKIGKIEGLISGNKYTGAIDIPHGIDPDDRVYFEVDLPKNGISGESNMIEVIGPVETTNMKWSAKEARRGDVLTLSADIQGVRTNTEVALVIYEHDQDGAHDRITEIPALVKSKKIEAKWEYEYHEDTDEIATQEEAQRYGTGYNPPEYFFTIKLADVELGKKQESGLLKFKDWVMIELKDKDGNAIPNKRYTINFADGTNASGTLDNSGCARHDSIPPGPYTVEFEGISGVSQTHVFVQP